MAVKDYHRMTNAERTKMLLTRLEKLDLNVLKFHQILNTK